MTNVITLASRCAAPTMPTMGTPDTIQLHAEAHNALAMALHYLRQPAERLDIEAKNLRAAVARVNRAMALMAVAQAELTCAEGL